MENLDNFNIDKRWDEKLDRDKVDKKTFAKNILIVEENNPDSSGLEDFSYTFKTGEVIKSKKWNNGLIDIVVESKNGNGFNLNDFLPKGYKIVTKRYVEKLWQNKPGYLNSLEEVGDFACIHEEKLILINKITNPKQILGILHEIGHAMDDSEKFEIQNVFHNVIMQSEIREKLPKLSNKISSESERNANANALKLYRTIKQKFNIDLLEAFDSFSEIQEFIYTFLAHYRYNAELEFQDSKEAKGWSNSKLNELLGKKDYSFLEKLYDKNKLSRINKKTRT